MWHSPLLSLLLCTLLVLGQNLSDCTAFSSNGLAASQYQYYRFYDFRRMRSASPSNTSIQGTRAKTISDSAWKDDWYIRDYPRKSPGGYSIPVNYMPERVYITNETDSSVNATSFLSLNTERLDAETQDGGEILFTEFNISHASLRVLTRVHGAPGGVAGIFTYLNDTQESDIEIFTRTPSQYVQYSNQPASTGEPDWTPIPGATVNLTMPSGKVRTDWHVHRLDWTPGLSVFFLDDQQMNSTSLHVPVVSPPSGFYIDMWSANSSWSGSMEVGTNATMDILWIEMLFNTTEQDQVTGAKKICEVNAGVVAQVRASMGISVRSSPWLILVLAAVVSSVLT